MCITLESDEQEIRTSTPINKFLFLGCNMPFLYNKKENEFLRILIFATHSLMTIFNKCSKFQNYLINIIGVVTSYSHILLVKHCAVKFLFFMPSL